MLTFERVPAEHRQTTHATALTPLDIQRARIPGGWLLRMKGRDEASLTFVPDPTHAWDGSSLAAETGN